MPPAFDDSYLKLVSWLYPILPITVHLHLICEEYAMLSACNKTKPLAVQIGKPKECMVVTPVLKTQRPP